jgi:hypothetical protein
MAKAPWRFVQRYVQKHPARGFYRGRLRDKIELVPKPFGTKLRFNGTAPIEGFTYFGTGGKDEVR